MVRRIDLNADVGEERGDDEALLAVVTSANVATGAHAGGGAVLDHTVRLAAAASCSVGAHPSYRDRENFGRVTMAAAVELPALIDDLVEQVLAVANACRRHHATFSHVKAHGALYNDATTSDSLAAALVAMVLEVRQRVAIGDLALMGPAGSAVERAAARAGIPFVREAFADRAYMASGLLAPRTVPNAVIDDTDVVVARALDMAEGRAIETLDDELLVVPADSICLHGDTPGAVGHAREIRRALESAGVDVRAPRVDR